VYGSDVSKQTVPMYRKYMMISRKKSRDVYKPSRPMMIRASIESPIKGISRFRIWRSKVILPHTIAHDPMIMQILKIDDHKMVIIPTSKMPKKTTPDRDVKNSGAELDAARNNAPAIIPGIFSLEEIMPKASSSHSDGHLINMTDAQIPARASKTDR
jgi:hypothetical protein